MFLKEEEELIIGYLFEYAKASWADLRDFIYKMKLGKIEEDSVGVTVVRYIKHLQDIEIVKKNIDGFYILTEKGYNESYKLKAKSRLDELDTAQIKAFGMLLDWYKNMAIIKAPKNASPYDYLKLLKESLQNMSDEKLVKLMKLFEL